MDKLSYKFTLHCILLVFLSLSLNAQVQLNAGQAELIFNANNGAAPQVGTVYAIPPNVNQLTWIISFATQPGSVTTILETSNDNSTWATVDTSTNVLGESRGLFTAAKFVRATESARSGGSAITVSVIGKSGTATNISGGVVFPNSFGIGDILYANTTSTLTNLVIGASGYLLGSNGTIPGWTNTINTSGSITAANITGSTSLTGTSGISSGTSGFLSIAAKGFFDSASNGLWRLSRADATIGSVFKVDALPTVASGFGTSSSITAGSTALAGSVNIGTGGVAVTGTINFNGTAFPSAPFCTYSNSTSNQITRGTPTTTQLVLNVTTAWTASDIVSWTCVSSR